MRVILLKDVENLGKKYEIKEVADGYARNYLIPNKLVKIANEKNLTWLKNKMRQKEEKAEEELKKIQELASRIDGEEITMEVAVGEKEQLFESITPQKIANKLKELGFNIKKDQISLKSPIKELGEFEVNITFPHNLEAKIKLIVEKQK